MPVLDPPAASVPEDRSKKEVVKPVENAPSPASPPAFVPEGGSKEEVVKTPPTRGLSRLGWCCFDGRSRDGPCHSTESNSNGRFLNAVSSKLLA